MLRRRTSRFPMENLMSHNIKKLRRGKPLCFTKLLISKKNREKRRGRKHDFPSKLFCLRVPKKFSVTPFSLSPFLAIEKFFFIRVLSQFSVVLYLALPKHFLAEHFVVS